MNVSAIVPAAPTSFAQDIQSVPSSSASKLAGNLIPANTVSISHAAQQASRAGEVDHDGDSH